MSEREQSGPRKAINTIVLGVGGQLAQLAYTPAYTPGRVASLLTAPSLAEAVRHRVVLVTGASSGVGRATALAVGRAGGTVVLVARSKDALTEVAAEIAGRGGQAHVHACDLTDAEAVDALVATVNEQLGGVDVLVNNAGHSIRRSVSQSVGRPHDFERTMSLNYFGGVRLTLGFLAGMLERRRGHIINVSTLGLQANTPRFSAYLASKAALDMFARTLATETRHKGIRVTSVHLPLVRTPMIAPTAIYRRAPALTPEQAAAMITEAIRTRPTRVVPRAGHALEFFRAVTPQAFDGAFNRAYLASRERPAGAPPAEPRQQSLPGRVLSSLRVRL